MQIDEENNGLKSQPWKKMGLRTLSSRANEYFSGLSENFAEGNDLLKVLWLSITLFFIVGGYWLLRYLKDPIMSAIDGVSIMNKYKYIIKQLIRLQYI